MVLIGKTVFAQNAYALKQHQFLSYGKIPTWAGVAVNWQNTQPAIHFYDSEKYKGHAEYVSSGLNTGISFKQFKEEVKGFETRKYLPFFFYDLRDNPVAINGQNYTWALRLEYYSFTDNNEQMVQTTLKLLKSVKKYIEEESEGSLSGIIILANSVEVKPNISIAPEMNAAGFPNITLSELIKKAGALKLEILNPGIAYGYLKMGKTTGSEGISYKDIIIYESLPERVPVVSGIITLEPQTPLSHVNLLAKNRGTINLYATEIDNLPGAEALLGKLVKISCSETKFQISEAGLKEAEKFWNKKRSIHVNIPIPDKSVVGLVDLNSSVNLSATVIGAKASNYALIQKEFPDFVKPGFAVPISYYFKAIEDCKAGEIIRQMLIDKDSLSSDDINAYLKEIRETILKANFPEDLSNEIKKIIQEKYDGEKIRLRSSTNCEDLPDFNGAGLYISKGYSISDNEQVLIDKILEVYASIWSPLAFAERDYYHIDHSKAGMAILINPAYTGEVANGVVLTIPSKDKTKVIINAQSDNNAVTNPSNAQIPESILFLDASKDDYSFMTQSNIEAVFYKNEELTSILLQLKKIAIQTNTLLITKNTLPPEKTYGVDIEFKIVKESGRYELYIKQARLLGGAAPE